MKLTLMFKSTGKNYSYNPNESDILDGIAAYKKAIAMGYTGSIDDILYEINLIQYNYWIHVDYEYASMSKRFKNLRTCVVQCDDGVLNKFTDYKLNGRELEHFIDKNAILEEWKNLGYPLEWKITSKKKGKNNVKNSK